MKRTGILFAGCLLFLTLFISCTTSKKYSGKISISDIDYIYNSIFNGARLGLGKMDIIVDREYRLIFTDTKGPRYEIEIYERADIYERMKAYDDSIIPVMMTFKFHNDSLIKISCRWNRTPSRNVDGLNHHLSEILGKTIELICRGGFCHIDEKVVYDSTEIYLIFTVALNVEVLSISYEDDLI